MTTKRVVHVEDGDIRYVLGDMFDRGFDPDQVKFESRSNFELVAQEIAGTMPLAAAYILDHEVNEDLGGEMALRIREAARSRGEQVLVISLLCSSVESARKKFGQQLNENHVPILNKNYDAPLCGFYIGDVLRQGFQPFQNYTAEQGIILDLGPATSSLYTSLVDIQTEMMRMISVGEPGLFYQSPRAFVDRFRKSIKENLHGESGYYLDKKFPPLTSGGERMNG